MTGNNCAWMKKNCVLFVKMTSRLEKKMKENKIRLVLRFVKWLASALLLIIIYRIIIIYCVVFLTNSRSQKSNNK